MSSAPPADSFDALLGIIRPPDAWPPMQVRVTHTINTLIVTITIVAYVRVASALDPPDPPPPANGIPPPEVPTGPIGSPSTAALGVGGNAILRPPC